MCWVFIAACGLFLEVLSFSCPVACGILVPQPGIESESPVRQFLNHWTSSVVPFAHFKIELSFFIELQLCFVHSNYKSFIRYMICKKCLLWGFFPPHFFHDVMKHKRESSNWKVIKADLHFRKSALWYG